MFASLRTITVVATRQLRWTSTAAAKLVRVTKNDNGISEISMERKPVNGLNLELLTELKDALVEARENGSEGIVLTSSLPTIFSAGLDILEMYKPDESRVRRFWTMLQDTWITLYGLGIPTAAAITGASPAGGCLLAMCCDYRVMLDGGDKCTIGLNETRLGIAAPRWFMTTMIDIIGQRQAELALLRGKLFTSHEALKIGLIDDIATDKQQTLSKCHDFVASFAMISGRARNATKMSLREERIAWLRDNRERDIRTFIGFIQDPEVQFGLNLYIQSLKKKSQ